MTKAVTVPKQTIKNAAEVAVSMGLGVEIRRDGTVLLYAMDTGVPKTMLPITPKKPKRSL